MCGIVGYIGSRNASDVLIDGLRRLEYRGYDSSGLAVLHDGRIELRRTVGKLSKLINNVSKRPVAGTIGIGHTRWATHGRPSEENAHPHMEGGVAVVHNGIIENYLALREELKKEGARFKSETDTEILAHLISREVRQGRSLEDSVMRALHHVKGTYAIAVISRHEPNKIVGARKECPLIVGLGQKEVVLSSDIPAILDITRKALFLEDGDVAVITRNRVAIKTLNGQDVERAPVVVDWTPVMAEKGGYRHFMLKEIFEQPRAITDTFRGNLMEESGDIFFSDLSLSPGDIDRIYIIACGTSWHAGLVGKFLMEGFSAIPTEVDLASEFRYRNPLVGRKTLVIAISQSGETADTLAAVREAKRKGAYIIAICNVMESSITRDAHWNLMTRAGPEIGVASTKAFTTQLVSLYMLSLYFARKLKRIDEKKGRELVQELVRLPMKLERVLNESGVVEDLARRYFHYSDFLYLGRGINYPIALEGALKLKEISYIHAEGYPAGEMKHGPIALIDENMPVVVLAPNDSSYPKIIGNVEEVRARGGRIIAIVNDGDREVKERSDDFITVPSAPYYLMPVILTLPLQLLAYYIAVFKGTDVDQPRNLAKSVTVE